MPTKHGFNFSPKINNTGPARGLFWKLNFHCTFLSKMTDEINIGYKRLCLISTSNLWELPILLFISLLNEWDLFIHFGTTCWLIVKDYLFTQSWASIAQPEEKGSPLEITRRVIAKRNNRYSLNGKINKMEISQRLHINQR